ncbi:MAG: peptide chain release factor 1 [Deltaproteobacteria bacterium]|nr:peptide chain release factor 1 [Deltaproteobacteria bacterium]
MEAFEQLEKIVLQHAELEKKLSDPEVLRDRETYQKYAKEHAAIAPVVTTYGNYKRVHEEIRKNQELLSDADEDLRQLAREEIQELRGEVQELEEQLRTLITPKDPNDEKNIVLEIRAGTGGDEAALFAASLFRMYTRYAELRRWKTEVLSRHATGVGGFKEIIALIEGRGAYSRLKFESGVHRVQRVPVTEAQGRIHTSTVTVAVLPEAEEVEIQIDPDELRIDVYRSTGHGGQSVNTTDSAVRVTHLPTGIVVTCQDEKSQHKNKAKALKVLRARLLDIKAQEQQDQISKDRKNQVGTGERSERIRTYNFPQGRVTDHRIGLTLYKLEQVLEGDLDPVIEPLFANHQVEIHRPDES